MKFKLEDWLRQHRARAMVHTWPSRARAAPEHAVWDYWRGQARPPDPGYAPGAVKGAVR